jgi:hypothetical protein
MGSSYIVRRGGGGVSERTVSPSINFVSKRGTEIVVNFRNNDAAEADVFYGLTSPLTEKVTLATDTTSSNITFSGLDPDTQYTISAYAIVTDATLKKIKSEIVSTVIITELADYTEATGGDILEYDLDGKRYRSHTFTSNGNFVVTQIGNEDRNQVDYLIIAGGAGGGNSGGGSGNSHTSGGGGAGGYRTTFGTQGGLGTLDPKVEVTTTTYAVTIGAGGASVIDANFGFNGRFGFDGTASSVAFPTTITAVGGGGGGGRAGNNGRLGGSGGGAGGSSTGANSPGSGTADQGFGGGTATIGSTAGGGGGGGAGGAGFNSSGANAGGSGGNGLSSVIRTGLAENRAGGGGGGRSSGATDFGGGFSGSPNGVDNTGGGGFATNGGNSGSGGSGIVIIRYEIEPTT